MREQATHRVVDVGSSLQQGVIGGEALTRLSQWGDGGHWGQWGEWGSHRAGAAGVEVQL